METIPECNSSQECDTSKNDKMTRSKTNPSTELDFFLKHSTPATSNVPFSSSISLESSISQENLLIKSRQNKSETNVSKQRSDHSFTTTAYSLRKSSLRHSSSLSSSHVSQQELKEVFGDDSLRKKTAKMLNMKTKNESLHTPLNLPGIKDKKRHKRKTIPTANEILRVKHWEMIQLRNIEEAVKHNLVTE